MAWHQWVRGVAHLKVIHQERALVATHMLGDTGEQLQFYLEPGGLTSACSLEVVTFFLAVPLYPHGVGLISSVWNQSP